MSDNQSLEELWQQQPTKEPNFEELKTKFKAVRRKQWLYIGLDVSSCIALVFMIIYFPQKMNTLQLAFMIFMTLCCFGSVTYITWLRSFTLRNTVSNTQAYLQGLKNQYRVNIKIGHFTKLVSWVTLAFLIVFYTITILTQDWDTTRLIKKTLFLIAFMVFALWPARIWANRQITKYSKEIKKLTLLEQSMSSEKAEVEEENRQA